MGLIIKKNTTGHFNLKSSISDEQLHQKKWINSHEAKKILIKRAFFNFLKNCIEIDIDFPKGYQVNGKIHRGEEKSIEKIMSLFEGENAVEESWKKLKEKYKLEKI